jgi:hypothetical protein
MARQAGPIPFIGTLGELTGYEMNGRFYLKRKSEVSQHRLRHHKIFAPSRAASGRFGDTSSITSSVYRQLPKGAGGLQVWQAMRRRTQAMVEKEVPGTEIIAVLSREFLLPAKAKKAKGKAAADAKPKVSEVLELGRAYGRIDPPAALIDQLSAINTIMQKLLHRQDEPQPLQPLRFKQTTRLRGSG